ncbi:MAG: VacJ family lipoprotein [Burkholderiales bacterium]
MLTVPHRIKAVVLSLLLSLAFLGGCASTNPRDPMEPMNRAFYSFNDGLDNAVLKPVAEGYRAVLPSFARTGVSNFFANINDVLIALNNLLQGKIVNAISDLGRVVINTTVGILGLMDPATELGLEKHNEDFGQTLGYWGIGDGAYIVIPLLGPSNVRDALGKVVDFKTDPVTYINHIRTRNVLWGTRIISNRADLLDTSKILEAAALDPYEFVRDAYLQRRRNLVHDGSPPPENDNDGDIKMKPRTDATPSPNAEQAIGGGVLWQNVASGRADNWTPAREEAAALAAQTRLKAERERAVQQPVAPEPRADLDTLIPTAPTAAGEPSTMRQPQVVRVWAPQNTAAQ